MSKCFYHMDNDGRAAAYWVAKKTEVEEFIPIEHGMDFPMSTIKEDEEVWIVDYSIQLSEMRELLEITKNVIWIDHHKTAIEKYADFEVEIAGVRRDGIAGCLLTWLYIERPELTKHKGSDVVMRPVIRDNCPYFMRLIGDRDVWRYEYGDDTKHFHLATQTMNLEPLSPDWYRLEEDEEYTQIHHIRTGRVVEKFRDTMAKEYRDKFGYAFEWRGYRCYAINQYCSSEYFGEKYEEYDIVIPHVFNGKYWKVSMFVDPPKGIDASKIAVEFGGGGHKGACGFQCKELPWIVEGCVK